MSQQLTENTCSTFNIEVTINSLDYESDSTVKHEADFAAIKGCTSGK